MGGARIRWTAPVRSAPRSLTGHQPAQVRRAGGPGAIERRPVLVLRRGRCHRGSLAHRGGVSRHPARIVPGVRQARLYAGRLPVPGLHQHHGRRRAPPPCPTPTTPASQCSCGSRARRSTPIGPPTFLGERNLLTSCAGISSTSPVPPTAPDRLELGAMQAVDLSGLTAFPPCCHPACRRRWPGGAAAARRDDPATVSPGRRGGRQRRPYRGRP